MNIIKHVTQKKKHECMNFATKLIIIKSITKKRKQRFQNLKHVTKNQNQLISKQQRQTFSTFQKYF